MINIDAHTADWWLRTEMTDADNNYHRAQTVTDVEMDDADPTTDDTTLVSEGEAMWEANKTQIQAMLETIIKEKYKVDPNAIVPPTTTL